MRPVRDVVALILLRFREKGFSQVPGYNRFGRVRETDTALIVSREKGKDTPIPVAKLEAAVSAVREDPQVYDVGPARLREHGIRYITSPIWSLLHLVTKTEILN